MNVIEIKSRIENAKALDFGIVFNQCIELFKKVWVQGLIVLLLNLVLAIPVMMIVYIPIILLGLADAFSDANTYGSSTMSDFSGIMIVVMGVLYIFLILAMSTIALGLKAAFYRICKFKDLGQEGKEDYFYFLKKQYLGKTITLSIALIGIVFLATLLFFVPLIYAIVPLSFILVIYAFNPDLSISEIIKQAFNLGNKKWLISFGLLLITWFLSTVIGFLMCGFGIYVTSSFNYLPSYIIYKEVVGFDDESEQLRRIEQLTTF